MRDSRWYRPCSGDADQKQWFHRTALGRLRSLAIELGLEHGTYDIRSTKGGPAVSGEVILHHNQVYIQISQPFGGHDTGILIRTCEGQADCTGGRNHFVPLSWIDNIDALATKVREVQPALAAIAVEDHDAPRFRMG